MSALPQISLRHKPLPPPVLPDTAIWSAATRAGALWLAWMKAEEGGLTAGLLRFDAGAWQTVTHFREENAEAGNCAVDWEAGAERVRFRFADQSRIFQVMENGEAEMSESTGAWHRLLASAAGAQFALDESGPLLRKHDGEWLPVSTPNEVDGLAITESGWIYIGSSDATKGVSVHRCKVDEAGKWELVFERGGGRFMMAGRLAGMIAIGDSVLVGTLPAATIRTRLHAGFEMAEMLEDGTWRLLIGEIRVTPHGLEAPLTGLGPGLHALMPVDWCFFNQMEGRPLLGVRDEVEGFRIWSGEKWDWSPVSAAAMSGFDRVVRAEFCPAPDAPHVFFECENAMGARRVSGARLEW